MRKKNRENNNFSYVTVEIKVYRKKKTVYVCVTNTIKSKMETIANVTVFIHIDSRHSQKAIS